jgi:predicted kinase
MAGLPASGKSTLCRELAQRLKGTVLDKDKFRSVMFAERDIEYSREQDDLCMDVVLEAAIYIFRKDPSRFIFLDGRPFSRTYQIDEVIRTATALKQDWRILECVCADETAQQRLAESQEHPAGNRDYELYQRVKSQFEEITLPKTTIDTDQPLDVCIRRALEALT